MNTKQASFDLTGSTIGKLFVVQRIGAVTRNERMIATYRCACDCGKFVDLERDKIKRKKIASCGCVVSKVGRPRRWK